MTVKNYRFVMAGTGSKRTPWKTTGEVRCELVDAFDQAMLQTFRMLTEGNATYGQPGRCGGPYEINNMFIERIDA
jgi:hypothetical protein